MTITLALDGLHPTTVSCMEALQWLHAQRAVSSVLDMGCGSGILSVMAAHWWAAPIMAADIASQAVTDTQALAAAQGLEGRITTIRSDGFSNPVIAQAAPYELILFNLLAEPLVRMAPQVKSHLVPTGICVLSGILQWLEDPVVEAYQTLGFRLLHRVTREPWQTLVWKRAD